MEGGRPVHVHGGAMLCMVQGRGGVVWTRASNKARKAEGCDRVVEPVGTRKPEHMDDVDDEENILVPRASTVKRNECEHPRWTGKETKNKHVEPRAFIRQPYSPRARVP